MLLLQRPRPRRGGKTQKRSPESALPDHGNLPTASRADEVLNRGSAAKRSLSFSVLGGGRTFYLHIAICHNLFLFFR
jgi:hypothetical protein